ncbi:hypothetical protein [Flavobacterium alvei]|uniref:hypothetical protein n=1 Tax=Flavobacterium alvei TaxID=2080416 RepID=UPI0013FE2A3D|nr:hypothetical protein [Flavobacterium alvei]
MVEKPTLNNYHIQKSKEAIIEIELQRKEHRPIEQVKEQAKRIKEGRINKYSPQ